MRKPLSPRLKRILELVVRDHIGTAEPVGSESLVARHQLDLSSATIRKVMAELEELGLLAHPHTSAGRVPTEEGLRVYVNEILEVGRLSDEMRRLIHRQLVSGKTEVDSVLSCCSRVLSNITRHMGVAVAPLLEHLTLKQLYFVRLGPGEILALVAAENGLVQNKLIRGCEDHSQEELNQVNNYLASLCRGATLLEVKAKIIEAMGREKESFDKLYARALSLYSEAVAAGAADEDGRSIYAAGQGNLLENPEFSETEAMKTLFKAFEDKRRIVELLGEVADEGRVRIVIGPEASAAALGGLALVASPYLKGSKTVGALGVIGPQRLNYSEIIPVVDYAAQVVSEILD